MAAEREDSGSSVAGARPKRLAACRARVLVLDRRAHGSAAPPGAEARRRSGMSMHHGSILARVGAHLDTLAWCGRLGSIRLLGSRLELSMCRKLEGHQQEQESQQHARGFHALLIGGMPGFR
jgi:hypothetical protein